MAELYLLPYQMIECAQRHLRADVFAHGNKCNAYGSKCLMQVVFFFFIEMVVADMEHFLDF